MILETVSHPSVAIICRRKMLENFGAKIITYSQTKFCPFIHQHEYK
jgi:hypothetical protein